MPGRPATEPKRQICRESYPLLYGQLSPFPHNLFWALATAVRARPSPLHIKKALASKWYKKDLTSKWYNTICNQKPSE